MQQNKYENMTIALAGILQAVCLIKELAQTGKINEKAFETSLNSLFQTHPDNALQVFGSVEELRIGLEKLIHILSPRGTETSAHHIRQMLSLMRLQRKLARNPAVLSGLAQRINQAKKQVDYFSLTHPIVISNLADIYLSVIHPFRYRFLILGNQPILSVKENMEKIRTLLLAGVRAAVLWSQMGGSRFQLLFARKKIKNTAIALLHSLQPEGQSL